jgi:hypothetical protein
MFEIPNFLQFYLITYGLLESSNIMRVTCTAAALSLIPYLHDLQLYLLFFES